MSEFADSAITESDLTKNKTKHKEESLFMSKSYYIETDDVSFFLLFLKNRF
jgi:hypothetical protein